ncbi:MAG: HD-GYP domain-containing protein, partial [Actinomycetota bacterium]|nr:HD-GYP domain-containing protein [Actinomycetota bacterium]
MTSAITPQQELDPGLQRLLEEAGPREATRLRGRERLAVLLVGGAFLACALAIALLLDGGRALDPGVAVALTAVFALASRIEFDVGGGYTVPTELVLVPMLFLLPPELVPLLVAAGFLGGKVPDFLAGRTNVGRAWISLGDSWHALGPALVFAVAGVSGVDFSQWPVWVAALAAQLAVDLAASTVRQRLAFGVAPRLHVREIGWVYSVDLLLAPIGLLAAFAGARADYAFLLVLPLCGLLWLFGLERRVRMKQGLALSHAYRGTALLLGDLVEDDDAYTGRHSRGVVELAVAAGERLGMDEAARRDLEFAALLHDVGKVSIPKEIINKAGPLTHEEMALVRTHTIEGHRILGRFGGVLGEVGRVVRSCHERWDGAGYPDGLEGERIPLAARVIFVCDAFSAMTTDRPYRDARPVADALVELRAHAGAQFDPRVVDVVAS